MTQDTPPPKAATLENLITGGEKSPPSYVDSESQAAAERIELDGRKQFFELRKTWSENLKYWINFLLIFHVSITVLIGFRFLNFNPDQWFIRVIVAEDFLQIVGMGYIVMKFLYPGTGDKKPEGRH